MKNASSVCAASWTTWSASIRPGQPLEREIARREHAEPHQARSNSRLGVDDHVGDVGPGIADPRLDLARPPVGVGQGQRRVEAERQERDQPFARVEEAQLPRIRAHDAVADDRRDPRRVRGRATASVPSPASDSGSRCVWTESTSGTAAQIARSTDSATAWASSSRSSPAASGAG